MSWIEEQSYFGLEELCQEAIEEYETIKYRFLNYNLWTTKDDKIIPIKLLSNNHINNIIKKIERENWRTYAYNKLKKELNERNKTNEINSNTRT